MRLAFASYNIHKGVGIDRRRDPGRTLEVIDELEADIVALQEVDRRIGTRAGVLDREELARRGWQVASVPHKPASLGWHGNALLVREGIAIRDVEPVTLPQIEPRGALRSTLVVSGRELCVTCMHLDLSGVRRRAQFGRLCAASRAPGTPAVMLGDCNEWMRPIGGELGLAAHWQVAAPGRSFPSTRPMLALDRLMHTDHWRCIDARVHGSSLARMASDHLPIRVELELLPDS